MAREMVRGFNPLTNDWFFAARGNCCEDHGLFDCGVQSALFFGLCWWGVLAAVGLL